MDRVDQQRIDELRRLLGPAGLRALGEELAQRLAMIEGLPEWAVADHLHRLRGSSASLGLQGLCEAVAAAEAGACNLADLAARAADIVPILVGAAQDGDCQR
jgi:hypothetical protein